MAEQHDRTSQGRATRSHDDRATASQAESGKRDRETLDPGHLDEPNPSQRQSDATNDASSLNGVEQPTLGTTSDANGLSAADEADGKRRRKQYEAGVELVSKPD